MARKTRIAFPGAVYHIMARGNERARIFHTSKDYELFLEAVRQALERFGVELKAYCLMPNHVHLAIKTPCGNISKFMAWLQTTFTVRYNRDHKRSGHLFQGRYRAELVEEADYAKWLILYIHLNPIRSRKGGLAHYIGGFKELRVFPWSSHQDYAGLRHGGLVNLEWLKEWNLRSSLAHKAYLADINRQIRGKELLDWKVHVKHGLAVGTDKWILKIQKWSGAKGDQEAGSTKVRLELTDRKRLLSRVLDREKDLRNRIWIRVKLLGESQVDLARELGYKSSVAIHQIAKRVEERAIKEKSLQDNIETWKNLLNVKD